MILRFSLEQKGVAILASALFALLLASCTLERRVEEGGVEEGSSSSTPPVNESEFAEELARQTVELFRDAVFAGDISRALSLLDEGIILIDPIVGRSSESLPVGEVLVELRRRHAAGILFEPLESEVELLPSGMAVVVTTLALLEEVEGIGEEVGRIYESALLVPSVEGWAIVHIHRSLLSEP